MKKLVVLLAVCLGIAVFYIIYGEVKKGAVPREEVIKEVSLAEVVSARDSSEEALTQDTVGTDDGAEGVTQRREKKQQRKSTSDLSPSDAISMLKRYGIIDQLATGEIVTSVTNEWGKEYRQNPIKQISNELLYHFMMYEDGMEELGDYPYIDRILELYKRANTEQAELQAQGAAKLKDDLNEMNRQLSAVYTSMVTGQDMPQKQEEKKILKRLPVRCLQALVSEGARISDIYVCRGYISEVKPLDEKLLEWLNSQCAEVSSANGSDQMGRTPLMYAAQYSTAEACQKLIAAGADVNAKMNDNGFTPLMAAAFNEKNHGVCDVLIAAGAEVNARDNEGLTPLMYAARNSTAEACQKLIAAGAEVNAKKNNGWTPLILAAYNEKNHEVCDVLIAAGAEVNFRDNEGWTPLMLAARYFTAEVCQKLIAAGAEVNVKNNNGWTPLMLAARNSTAEACQKLIAAGAEVNAKKNDGATPLMLAAHNEENQGVCDVLIAAGADVNAKDNDGYTPLMLAAYNEKDHGVRNVLINAGAAR